jgi:hypothetical protein
MLNREPVNDAIGVPVKRSQLFRVLGVVAVVVTIAGGVLWWIGRSDGRLPWVPTCTDLAPRSRSNLEALGR